MTTWYFENVFGEQDGQLYTNTQQNPQCTWRFTGEGEIHCNRTHLSLLPRDNRAQEPHTPHTYKLGAWTRVSYMAHHEVHQTVLLK